HRLRRALVERVHVALVGEEALAGDDQPGRADDALELAKDLGRQGHGRLRLTKYHRPSLGGPAIYGLPAGGGGSADLPGMARHEQLGDVAGAPLRDDLLLLL